MLFGKVLTSDFFFTVYLVIWDVNSSLGCLVNSLRPKLAEGLVKVFSCKIFPIPVLVYNGCTSSARTGEASQWVVPRTAARSPLHRCQTPGKDSLPPECYPYRSVDVWNKQSVCSQWPVYRRCTAQVLNGLTYMTLLVNRFLMLYINAPSWRSLIVPFHADTTVNKTWATDKSHRLK